MFRIHKVFDVTTPTNRQLLSQVQAMLRVQFQDLSERDIAKLPVQLANPLKYRFRSILMVAEDGAGTVRGFAMLLHAPDLEFCYLDYVCAGRGATGGGIGGALYERVREEANQLGVIGIFLECLPDDPALSPDATIRKQCCSEPVLLSTTKIVLMHPAQAVLEQSDRQPTQHGITINSRSVPCAV